MEYGRTSEIFTKPEKDGPRIHNRSFGMSDSRAGFIGDGRFSSMTLLGVPIRPSRWSEAVDAVCIPEMELAARGSSSMRTMTPGSPR